MLLSLEAHKAILVRQRKELAEILLDWESRNKYELLTRDGQPLGFAAEQSKGLLGSLFRQTFGHWRTFEIHIFDTARQLALVARHPFRFLFQRLELSDYNGQPIGVVQQRFGLLYKRFDVLDPQGRELFKMASPRWRLWTFPFFRMGQQIAVIKKKWSGLLTEAFTDADNFLVEFSDALSVAEKSLVAAAALFVDLLYFEKKADS